MSATITDYFNKASNMSGGYPAVATVTAARSTGGSTLSCDDLSSWATDTPVHFSTFKVNTDGTIDTATQTDWKGIVNGNTITDMTRLAGAADSGNASGDRVELNPTIGWLDDLITGILVSHKQNGALKDNAVTESSIATGAVTSSKVAAGAISSYDKIGDDVIQARNVDFSTIDYYTSPADFTGSSTETSRASFTLPAGTYLIGVKAHVGTGGSSATNYSANLRARLNSVSGTEVAVADYYFWQETYKQDIGVDIFDIGKVVLAASTVVHLTAKCAGDLKNFSKVRMFATRIG